MPAPIHIFVSSLPSSLGRHTIFCRRYRAGKLYVTEKGMFNLDGGEEITDPDQVTPDLINTNPGDHSMSIQDSVTVQPQSTETMSDRDKFDILRQSGGNIAEIAPSLGLTLDEASDIMTRFSRCASCQTA